MKKGFVAPEKIETRKDGAEHVLGSATLPGIVVMPSGDWTPYVSPGERQQRNTEETYACTVFNTLNAIEDAIYQRTGTRVNYSDRYVANLAVMKGILDPTHGANPHLILELIRTTSGLLAEEKLPWDDNFYTVEQSLMAELMLEGPAWYKEWRLNHFWLWNNKPSPLEERAIIEDALTKGVVCVSVYAWIQGPIDDLYIKPQGVPDGHWTGLRKVEKKDSTYLWYVCSDSYEPFVKKLDPLFDFQFGKIIFISPRHTFLKNLYYGMSDPEVPELQKALISLGYSIPHAATYLFGSETRKALWQFQVSQGINDDGSNFGPKTRYALNKKLNPSDSVFGSFLMFISTYLGVDLWLS